MMETKESSKRRSAPGSFGFSPMVLRVAKRLEKMCEEGYRGRVVIHYGDAGIAKLETGEVLKGEEI